MTIDESYFTDSHPKSLDPRQEEKNLTNEKTKQAVSSVFALGIPPILEPHPPHYEIMVYEILNGRPKFV